MKINGQLKQLHVDNVFPWGIGTTGIKFYDGDVTNLSLLVQKAGDVNANTTTTFPFGTIPSSDGASGGLTTDIVKDDVFYVAPIAMPSMPQGNVVISKWTNEEIERTFSFTAVGQNKPNVSIEVTEGKFYVKKK